MRFLPAAILAAAFTFVLGWIVARWQADAAVPAWTGWRDRLEVETV